MTEDREEKKNEYPVCYCMTTDNKRNSWRPATDPTPEKLMMSTYMFPEFDHVLSQLDDTKYMACVMYKNDTQVGGTGKALFLKDVKLKQAAYRGCKMEIKQELGLMIRRHGKLRQFHHVEEKVNNPDGKKPLKRHYTYYVIKTEQLKEYQATKEHKVKTKPYDNKANKVCFMVVGTLGELIKLFKSVKMREAANDTNDITGVAFIRIDHLKTLPRQFVEWNKRHKTTVEQYWKCGEEYRKMHPGKAFIPPMEWNFSL